MDFYPNPFEVGNFSMLGMLENDIENRALRMILDIKDKYGLHVPAYIITEELQQREIPYELLPQYIIDMIDEFDVY